MVCTMYLVNCLDIVRKTKKKAAIQISVKKAAALIIEFVWLQMVKFLNYDLVTLLYALSQTFGCH